MSLFKTLKICSLISLTIIFLVLSSGKSFAKTSTSDNPQPLTPTPSSSSSNTNSPNQPQIGKPEYLPFSKYNIQNNKDYFISIFIPGLVKIISAACGGFAFIMLVFSGLQYLTAYGQEEQITSAKKTAIWAVIGLVIILASYSIVSIITSLELPNGAPPPPK